jgi:hypothetical protein
VNVLTGFDALVGALDVVGHDIVVLDAGRDVAGQLLLDAGTQQEARLPAVRAGNIVAIAILRHGKTGRAVKQRLVERNTSLDLGGHAMTLGQLAAAGLHVGIAEIGVIEFATNDSAAQVVVVAAVNAEVEALAAGKRVDPRRRYTAVSTDIST